ncbi:hypothetical protein AB0M43_35045 [Longispora sp. NPDC051575]|uniref:hypothetical protein n=1 Tax=Longispora sp. NPDC051575 TaxID=3154943 RepID=UPI00341CD9BD
MFLPLVPFDGGAVTLAADLADRARHGGTAPAALILNVLDADTIDHLVSLRFAPEDPGAVTDAHRTLDLLHGTFTAHGFAPYRTDVDHPTPRTPLHQRLKDALDPGHVFAANR